MKEKESKEKKRKEKKREKKNQLKSKKFQRYELVKGWKRTGNKELLLSLSFCILRPIISISKKKEGKTTKLLLDSFFRLIVDILKFN